MKPGPQLLVPHVTPSTMARSQDLAMPSFPGDSPQAGKPAWNKGLEQGPFRGCGHNASPSIRTGTVSPQLLWKDGRNKGQALRTQPSAKETEQRPGG